LFLRVFIFSAIRNEESPYAYKILLIEKRNYFKEFPLGTDVLGGLWPPLAGEVRIYNENHSFRKEEMGTVYLQV
jgi:hypothetical protein